MSRVAIGVLGAPTTKKSVAFGKPASVPVQWKWVVLNPGLGMLATVSYGSEEEGVDWSNCGGALYAYAGGTTWVKVKEWLSQPAPRDVIRFDGKVFVSLGHVYCSSNLVDWDDCSPAMPASNVISSMFAVHDDVLHVGVYDWSDGDRASRTQVWSYNGSAFELVSEYSGEYLYRTYGALSLFSHGGSLYVGEYALDNIYRVAGAGMTAQLETWEGSCVFDMVEFGSDLYAAAYAGYVFRSVDGGSNWELWSISDDYGITLSYWCGLAVYDGAIYGAGYDWDTVKGGVYRFTGAEPVLVKAIPGNGAIKLAVSGDSLYVTTGVDGWYDMTYGDVGHVWKLSGGAWTRLTPEGGLGVGVQRVCLGGGA